MKFKKGLLIICLIACLFSISSIYAGDLDGNMTADDSDGKLKALKTIFIEDRMAGKTEKTNMYIFDETTYHKEIILKNRENYGLKAKNIGKNTI